MNRNSFRVDRMATLHVAGPLRRIINKERDSAVPVLMYHSISDPDDRFLHPYFETSTSSRVFEEQMKYLSDNGYSSIGLNELPTAVNNGSSTDKFVVLTFDDGCRDFCDSAFSILEKYGFKATVFLATGLMGTKRSPLVGREIMDWSDAQKLQKQGIMFGSHTVNHRILKKLTWKDMEYELRISKEEIESRLGKLVDSFSYPYAYPEECPAFEKIFFHTLSNCGYRFAVTTVIGRVAIGDNPLALKRLPINEYDDPVFFKAKLEGAYDWVHLLQYFRKKCFGWVGA